MLDIILRWALPAALASICGLVSGKISRRKKENKSLRDGLQCVLRTQIVTMHDEYVNKKKYCPVYVRETVSKAYHAYEKLGGNDVATDLYNDILRLPTRPPSEV